MPFSELKTESLEGKFQVRFGVNPTLTKTITVFPQTK